MSFWIPAAIGAVTSFLGAKDATSPIDLGALAKQGQPWQDKIDSQWNMSQNLMDPNSEVNNMFRRMTQEQGYDQMAFQNLMGGRGRAGGGMGGFSGIGQQQDIPNMNKANYQALVASNQAQQQRFGSGLNLMQSGIANQQKMSENMQQAYLSNDAMQRQQAQGQVGFGQGLMEFGLQGLFGG